MSMSNRLQQQRLRNAGNLCRGFLSSGTWQERIGKGTVYPEVNMEPCVSVSCRSGVIRGSSAGSANLHKGR